jgi:hypothetical protein
MVAFTEELTKIGGSVTDYLRKNLAGRYGRQMMLGAGVGGVGNVLRHRFTDTPEERQQSGPVGQFLRGGLVGAGVAGGRILATKAGRQAAQTRLSNLYQKERYGLTGKGLGKTPQEELAKAQELGLVSKAPTAESVLGYDTGPMLPHESAALRRATSGHQREVAAFGEGYGSAPGFVHGLLSRPGHTLRETLGRKWQHGSGLDKLFMGHGAYSAARGMLEKPEEGGPGRLEKGLGGLGQSMAFAAGPSGLVASSLLGGVGHKLGRGVGRLGDKLIFRRGRVMPPAEQSMYSPQQAYSPEPSDSQSGAVPNV